MSPAQSKVVFLPSGRRGNFVHGTTLLDAARSIGVDLDSVCGGRGLCGRCRVVCAEGEFAKHAIRSHADHLSPPGDVEARYSEKRRALGRGERLGCQARVQGDLVVDVPPESQLHRQLVRKEAEHRPIRLDSSVHLYYVASPVAALGAAGGDLQRLRDALGREWELVDLDCDPAVLPVLQQALRDGDWRVTVAVHGRRTITAIWPGFRRDAFGIAIDVGSTTIAAHLCNLSTGEIRATGGIMNPQIRYGEDLMSRVSWVQMNPDAADELTRAVRDGINELVRDISHDAGIDPDDILDVTIAGNPVMHHLLLGFSPVELGSAPFALVTDEALNLRARELGLGINAGARVYVLPCIAGHVGADTAAMILAEQPHESGDTSLVVDVGTNAEIVLGNRDRLLACSSPTGPAFEGAQISCGQRAAAGAIERVRIDPATLDARFSVIGSELWSDDPGFAETVKAFGITGICGSGIIEAIAAMYLAGIVSADGAIDGSLASKTARLVRDDRTWSYVLYDGNPRIVVTQNDVRQVQLAKAALYAGVKLLMDRGGITAVDRIRLAGAFGSHIDPKYAMVLGMIPDCPLDRVASAGNAAGAGAVIALLDRGSRSEIESVVRNVEKVETAVESNFQRYFVDAMAIPNKSDEFPNLFKSVAPPPAAASKPRATPRRRRVRLGPEHRRKQD